MMRTKTVALVGVAVVAAVLALAAYVAQAPAILLIGLGLVLAASLAATYAGRPS
jgi:hypothetical protein